MMKLQKYLSQSGVCSRRKAEEYIAEGKITVNGIPAHIGQIVDPDVDVVKISDQVVEDTENLVYYKVNKPRGVVTTCLSGDPDEQGIMEIVDIPERVFPIGRLDKDTIGLLILTNDGRLSNYLMHPRYEHEKEYMVEVYGRIEDEDMERLSRGVKIEIKDTSLGGRRHTRTGGIKVRSIKNIDNLPPMKTYITKPCTIERISSGTFSIVLKEGKNRQIRRMVETLGYTVKRLKRIRIENIELGDLGEGEYKKFTTHERNVLFAGLDIGKEANTI